MDSNAMWWYYATNDLYGRYCCWEVGFAKDASTTHLVVFFPSWPVFLQLLTIFAAVYFFVLQMK